nr:MAG TPA_asm: hypothetical protein [Caudoviricetes sp.]
MECLLPGEEVGPIVARLTLGSRPTDPELSEATPGAKVCGFRMADITYKDDNQMRYAPMMIVFIHPEDACPADLFEAVGISG